MHKPPEKTDIFVSMFPVLLELRAIREATNARV
jgi:hypothetical protein